MAELVDATDLKDQYNLSFLKVTFKMIAVKIREI